MKACDCVKPLALSIAVIFFPSSPFSRRVVQNVNCFSAPTKFSPYQKSQHNKQHLKSSSEFADEVCHFLDRQPQVSYRNVELPLNVLAAFPNITKTGNKLIELERKGEIFEDKKKTENANIIALHLISTPTRLEECLPPKFQKDLTDYFNHQKENSLGGITNKKEYSKIIHLHQDIWNFKREIVDHRLMAQLGLGVHPETATNHQEQQKASGRVAMRRIFARKTMVRRITSTAAMEFLDKHHLWGATKARHNYGLFVRDKDNNVTNDVNEEELVAAATFSAKRKVVRLGKPHRSHELLRFCSKRDSNVVGGISKLIKEFVREKSPDDIVTVVDRDWGDGSGWHSFGFHSVATMDPIVMAVCSSDEGGDPRHSQRRHLVGAGIKSSHIENSNDNATGDNNSCVKKNDRIGLSVDILRELDLSDSVEDTLSILSRQKHFPVYDTGVERLMKVISYDPHGNELETTKSMILDIWQNSQPTYAKEYYSSNIGISTLLKHVSRTPSALPLLINGNTSNICE